MVHNHTSRRQYAVSLFSHPGEYVAACPNADADGRAHSGTHGFADDRTHSCTHGFAYRRTNDGADGSTHSRANNRTDG